MLLAMTLRQYSSSTRFPTRGRRLCARAYTHHILCFQSGTEDSLCSFYKLQPARTCPSSLAHLLESGLELSLGLAIMCKREERAGKPESGGAPGGNSTGVCAASSRAPPPISSDDPPDMISIRGTQDLSAHALLHRSRTPLLFYLS